MLISVDFWKSMHDCYGFSDQGAEGIGFTVVRHIRPGLRVGRLFLDR